LKLERVANGHTIGVKEIAREFHLGWAEWIVGRKCQSCCEHTTFKARPFWTTSNAYTHNI